MMKMKKRKEGIAVGRTFAALKEYQVDGNKEMIAIGLMNVVGSSTSCYVTISEASAPTGADPIAMMEFYTKAAQEEKFKQPKQSKDEMPPPASLQGPDLFHKSKFSLVSLKAFFFFFFFAIEYDSLFFIDGCVLDVVPFLLVYLFF
ncbi:hypothetical protein ACB092_09G040700 [Castanea dentata]